VTVIRASSLSETSPARLAVIFTVFALTGEKVTPVPSPIPPAAASELNETNTVAVMWSTRALAVDE
jgi:hypothetical protein